MCYDDLGRKTAMLDPDKGGAIAAANDATIACSSVGYQRTGWWTYKYNGFGELMEQADPKGQRTQMHYDKLGRMIGRVDIKANGSIESFTQWFYEKGVNAQATGINGKLTAVVMNSATNITQSQINTALADGKASCMEGNACFKTLYEFDALTRPQNTKTYYPGSTTAYTSWIDYDPVIGRVLRQYDPLDQQLTENGAKVISGTQTFYNDFGYVSAVRDIGTGQLISSITSMNARGQVTEEFRGNGATTKNIYDDLTGNLTNQQAGIGSVFSIQNISYKWDKIGNLKYRKNNSPLIGSTGNKNKQESFCYDALNRLTKTVASVSADYATGHSACSSPDMVYDGFGNIKTKNGVAYEYGTNAGPHAATKVGSATYTYDANGNAISGDGRTFDYTSYDMVAKITKTTNANHSVEFKYGPDRARWQRIDKNTGTEVQTTYIGNIERIYTMGGDIEWKRYVGGAIFTYKTNTSNQVQSKDKSWVYNDHLGSVDVITDNVGTIRHSMGFDPWGYRRDGENWENWLQLSEANRIAKINDLVSDKLKPVNMSRPITTRGYTGHEMVDDMGIIHMNGRIYDAKIARFLQADPFVDGARNTQGYNRYSYVQNNPLNATDPSGFMSFKDFIHGVPVHRFLNKNMPWAIPIIQIALNFIPYAGPYVSAAFSANNAYYLSGGSDWAAIKSYGVSMASYFVFKEIGESFDVPLAADGSNFWVAGVEGGARQIAAHAITGGVLSVVQGGKFGHGFVSAGLTKAFMSHAGFDVMNGKTSAVIGRTIVAGVVGGTISEITGGKFANGAITAAMAHLFNWESTREMRAVEAMKNKYLANYFAKMAHAEKMSEYAPEGVVSIGTESTAVFSFYGIKVVAVFI